MTIVQDTGILAKMQEKSLTKESEQGAFAQPPSEQEDIELLKRVGLG